MHTEYIYLYFIKAFYKAQICKQVCYFKRDNLMLANEFVFSIRKIHRKCLKGRTRYHLTVWPN